MENHLLETLNLLDCNRPTLNNFNKVFSIILKNNSEISEEMWTIYSKKFEKALKFNINQEEFLVLINYIKKKKHWATNIILRSIFQALKKYSFYSISFPSYLYFDKAGYQLYKYGKGYYKIKDEISIALWMYPKTNCREYFLLEMVGSHNYRFTVKITNKIIIINGGLSKNLFWVYSAPEIIEKRWNFIGITIKQSRNSNCRIKINENKLEDCTIYKKLNIESIINAISIGSSFFQDLDFRGKLASLVIYKKYLSKDHMEMLYNYPYFINFITRYEEKKIKALKEIEKDIIFRLYPEESIHNSDTDTQIASNLSVFSAYSLLDSLRLPYGFLNLFAKLDTKEFFTILDIYTFIFTLNDWQNYIFSVDILWVLLRKILSMEYKQNLHNKFTNLMLEIKSDNLQKIVLKCYLQNKQLSKITDHPQLIEVLITFQKLFKFTSKNIILLNSLFAVQTNGTISIAFSLFLERFNTINKCIEILSVLAIKEYYRLINGILTIIDIKALKGDVLMFFSVLIDILIRPIPYELATNIIIKIFTYYLILNEHTNKLINNHCNKKSNEFLDIIGCINEKFTGIDNIIDALSAIKIKEIRFSDKTTKKCFFNLISNELSNIESDYSFDKCIAFLSENQELIYPIIIKNDFFNNSMLKLFKISQVKATELLRVIFSHTRCLKNFEKLKILFIELEDKTLWFKIYVILWHDLIDTIYLNESLFADFMNILNLNNIDNSDSLEFCKIVDKYVELTLQKPSFCFNHAIQDEKIDSMHKYLGIILVNLIFKAGIYSSKLVKFSLKKFLEHKNVLYFNTIRFSTKDSAIYSIYFFTNIAELLYSNVKEYFELFEDFCNKIGILDMLLLIFKELEEGEFISFEKKIKEGKIRSYSKILININPKLIALNKNLTCEIITSTKESAIQLPDRIYSEDWIIHVHYILMILLATKWKKIFKVPSRIVQLFSPIYQKYSEKFHNLSKGIFENAENIILSLNSSVFLSKFQNKSKASSKKFRKCFTLNLKKPYKYILKNHKNAYSCWSLLKFMKNDIEYDEYSSLLLKNSMARLEDFIEKFSILSSQYSSRNNHRLSFQSIYDNAIQINPVSSKIDDLVLECEQIKISGSYFGKIIISKKYCQLVCEGEKKDPRKYPWSSLEFTIKSKKCNCLWESCDIIEVVYRKFLHRNTAFEVFLKNGKSYLINVFNETLRDSAFNKMKYWKSTKVCSSFPNGLMENYTSNWVKGRLTNFCYLMILNKYSGRSFHDISQFPIFPWILTRYDMDNLEINNPEIYRNFYYSIGAQKEKDRLLLHKHYEEGESEFLGKYHHGSHYSNGGIVLYYLSRLEPFSSQAKLLQSGHFDVADRLFYSMQIAWNSCSSGVGDVKELIPHLFYLPQCLENMNNYDMGKTRSNHNASIFILPKWAKNSWDFIRKHRKCLESSYTSSQIHNWIDLIFGYKQKHKKGIENFNIFCKATYDDILDNGLQDVSDENISYLIDQIYHFGQAPQQIFQNPHIKRQYFWGLSIFDELKYEKPLKKISIKLNYENLQEIIEITNNKYFLFIFFTIAEEIKYYRFKISDQSLTVFTIFELKSVVQFDFFKFSLILWKNFLLSFNYKDKYLRLHNSEGELTRTFSSKHMVLSVFICDEYLYNADYNIIIAWDQEFFIQQRYYGHDYTVQCIRIEKTKRILVSVDCSGIIILHNISTAEILHMFKQEAFNINISEFGILLANHKNIMKALSLEGNLLWIINKDIKGKFEFNKTTEYLVSIENTMLSIFDVFDNSIVFEGMKNLSFVSISKTDHLIFCIKAKNNIPKLYVLYV